MDPDSKDVLDKADALLRRRSPVGTETSGVPVLTDLVDDPNAAKATGDLARDVFHRVMAEVEGHLAKDLEARLAQRIVPQVHAAVVEAIGDLRKDLANAINVAIADAFRNRPPP